MFQSLLPTLAAIALVIPLAAQDAATPHGDPVIEAATLRSIGIHWLIDGDANANARIAVQYRAVGEPAWHQGPPLFRNERRAKPYKDQGGKECFSLLVIPPDGELFAGSVVQLQPDTAYELKLS